MLVSVNSNTGIRGRNARITDIIKRPAIVLFSWSRRVRVTRYRLASRSAARSR